MVSDFRCDTCSGFIPKTELLMPRCNNAGGCPLSEPKRFRIKNKGCPLWLRVPLAD
nr:hypothetical protein [uncultured Methanoregula sp.]